MDISVRSSCGIVLLAAAMAASAEPPKRNTSLPVTPPGVARPGSLSPAPLKLHVGDVRQYMMPSEFAAAINGSDPDGNTVVVEGKRELLPMKSLKPVAPGIAAPFWAVAHPTQAWRIFLPDPRAAPPGPPDVVPKPEVRLGP